MSKGRRGPVPHPTDQMAIHLNSVGDGPPVLGGGAQEDLFCESQSEPFTQVERPLQITLIQSLRRVLQYIPGEHVNLMN